MKLVSFIEDYFGGLLVVSILVGLFFPVMGGFFMPYLTLMLIVILFFTFLKIDFREVLSHLKKPLLLAYVLAVYLIVMPAVVFLVFQFVDPVIAVAFLLLVAIPAGVASPTLTDLMKGNTSLSLSLVILSHLLAPLTVPFLFYVFTSSSISLDVVGLMKDLALVILLPLVLASVVKRFAADPVDRVKKYFSATNVLILMLVMYTAVAANSEKILGNFSGMVKQVIWLYVLFAFLHIVGYLMIFWRKKEDKIATSCSKTYMNNTLAIVVAFKFLSPEIGMIMVLSELPWNTMPGIFKWGLKYLK